MTTTDLTMPPALGMATMLQTSRWLARPLELLRDCAATLGDAFTLDLGSQGRYAIVSRPSAVRALFTADPARLDAGQGNAVLLPLLGPGSLLLLEGERHARERRLLMPAFHTRRVQEYAHLIRDAALNACAAWRPGDEVSLHEATQQVSIRVVLEGLFGFAPGSAPAAALAERFQSFWNDPRLSLGHLGQLHDDQGGNAAWAHFRARFAEIEAMLRDEVDRRRAHPDPARGDVISMLLSATTPDGAPLDDASLRDELVTLLATGYETTATALAWAFQLVHLNPAVEERLRAELATLGPDPDPIALSREASYLRAVCDETLRIRPILPVVARRALAPVEIDGWLIPAGVTIAASIYLAHHRPEVYPNPDSFQPERFLTREHSPYEYLPFGGGPRRCLGMTLALHEMRIVLGTILSRVTLAPLLRDLRAVRRTVTLGPAGGVPMRVVAHRSRP